MTAKPATPLPWVFASNRGVVTSIATAMPRDVLLGHLRMDAELDMKYACEACNAYPKLLEDKRRLMTMVERLLGILNEWPVEQAAVPYGYGYALPEARALLAELDAGKP